MAKRGRPSKKKTKVEKEIEEIEDEIYDTSEDIQTNEEFNEEPTNGGTSISTTLEDGTKLVEEHEPEKIIPLDEPKEEDKETFANYINGIKSLAERHMSKNVGDMSDLQKIINHCNTLLGKL